VRTLDVSEKKILKLQKNLPIIRNLAGWTAEDLGNITNIEKSDTLSMTKTQYIAIRAVLDFEIEQSHNKTLAEAIAVLVDADDLTLAQEKQIEDTITTITNAKSRRVNDKLVLESMSALIAALSVIGGITLSQAFKKTSSVPKWLLDIMK
jgi:hypothetical protein